MSARGGRVPHVSSTLLAPADRQGAAVVHLTSEDTFIDGEAFFTALAGLGRRAPVVAFPDGSEHSYWHDRAEGDWGRFVTSETLPAVIRHLGIDPDRVAIGGISMGGFGAYDLALRNADRFCAVGGHSAALWFDGRETAPGAFDDAADFERNDVVGTVRTDPGAFGSARVWNDHDDTDPFRVYNEGFVEALGDNADLTARSWPGGHETSHWDRHWPAYLRFYADALASCH